MDTLPTTPSSDAASPNIPSTSQSHAEQWKSSNSAELELERMHTGVPVQCQFCVGRTFRRSRLRSSDIPSLLLMRYPVRCLRCAQRQTVSFTVAGVSAPSYLRRRDAPGTSKRHPDEARR